MKISSNLKPSFWILASLIAWPSLVSAGGALSRIKKIQEPPPPQEIQSLHRMIALGKSDIVKSLQRNKPELFKHNDRRGFNPVHTAAYYNQLEILTFLNSFDEYQPLFSDSITGTEALSFMLSVGESTFFPLEVTADPRFLTHPEVRCEKPTPLVLAIMRKNEAAAQFLLGKFGSQKSLGQNTQKIQWVIFNRNQKSGNQLLLGKSHSPIASLMWAATLQGMATVQERLESAPGAEAEAESSIEIRQALGFSSSNSSDLALLRQQILKMQSIGKLHDAIQNGDLNQVQLIIHNPDNNPDFAGISSEKILEPNRHGFNALHEAVFHGKSKIFQFLKSQYSPPNPDQQDRSTLFLRVSQPWLPQPSSEQIASSYINCTLLDLAILRNQPTIVEELLAEILNPAQQETLARSFQTSCGAYLSETPLEWMTRFAMWTALDRVLSLLPKNVIEHRNQKKQTFLHTITSHGFHLNDLPSALRQNISRYHLVVSDQSGHYPGDVEIFNKDTEQMKSLHQAVQDGSTWRLHWMAYRYPQYLIFGLHNRLGFNVIHTAAHTGNLKMLKKLRKLFPELNFFEKTTLPMEAVTRSDFVAPRMARHTHWLGSEPQENIGPLKDFAYATPLTLALLFRKESVVDYLLEVYLEEIRKNPQFSIERLGIEHLKLAIIGRMWGIAKRLLPLLDPDEVYATDSNGFNLLHAAARSGLHLDDIPKDFLSQLDPQAFLVRDCEGRIPAELVPRRELKIQ